MMLAQSSCYDVKDVKLVMRCLVGGVLNRLDALVGECRPHLTRLGSRFRLGGVLSVWTFERCLTISVRIDKDDQVAVTVRRGGGHGDHNLSTRTKRWAGNRFAAENPIAEADAIGEVKEFIVYSVIMGGT